ncbi:DsbA family protein [Mycobacterium sp. 21AC1]|uniref:DsbA family protein n=1 Tax=[Mycobacterium] appelbergii TaxID=2939269 RepID=UPI0029394195|nr:thioredoxin domain-containing protein [Mycobacterium sp. 21AC1]MDV3127622.1 DsbA family protein [Mycobacterium sp. 21AC1]
MSGSRRHSVSKDVAFIAGLVVVAAALILYLVMRPDGAGGQEDPTAAPISTSAGPPPTGQGETSAMTVERRLAGDPFAVGDPAAPVVLVMFADYRCPFCAKFSRDTEPELIDRFVDRGTLRIEWRDFPIFGDQSTLAARAARAAAEQGRFWEFNRAVFAASPERGHADLTEDALTGFAREAGVADLDRFSTAMRSNAFDAAINADLALGNSIGVPSTPAFLINDVPLLGAQPTSEFVQAIDNAAGGQ